MPQYIKALELRENFINYFRKNTHKLLAPSKIFLDSDSSLMFVNAGMNQLKKEFLDPSVKVESESKDDKFTRLCNSQLCIRAGGKHNDLDDVGLDSYHLTSFEMLGNWSINSYGKEEAIRLAYNYLTEHLGLDPCKMYVTYFKGDETQGIGPDTETQAIWTKYMPENRIIGGSFKDNFWMMAETGPCGQCTEIHYDISDEARFVPELVNTDNQQVIEIWNIVSIQYNRILNKSNGSVTLKPYVYETLSRQFIDTGMGMERLAMVLQHTTSLYKTDVFHYLMGYAQAIGNCKTQYSDTYDKLSPQYNTDCAYRIFCDHFRTIIYALYDGVEFDGSGRGHVLRKIFRRMLTYTYLYLNDFKVEQLMIRPITLGIISDILNYQLKYTHDGKKIQEQLIAEERMFIGVLQNLHEKLKQVFEQNEIDGSYDYVCVSKDPKRTSGLPVYRGDVGNLQKIYELYNKLYNSGIPALIVNNARKLKIKKLS
jgi:alanyl-tRNA synthetase